MLKKTWQEARSFVRRELVLFLAWVLAVISSLFSPPQLSYIDFHVLGMLFCLMLVVAGFKKIKLLDYLAVRILTLCGSLREVTAALVGIAFFASMLVTNDVALLTFVPLALTIGHRLHLDMAKIIIWQTLAANLGSALTPMGNPQNLFIYAHYKMIPLAFLATTGPLVMLALAWLVWLVVSEREQDLKVELPVVELGSRQLLYFYIMLFCVCLLAVFRLLDYRAAFLITVLGVAACNRRLFGSVDYSLLLTFCGFFIFIGNISNLSAVMELQRGLMDSAAGTYWLGILVSQFVSNVPAAMLLAGFTAQAKALLLGVNVGGLGTLVASMASVISYKLYIEANTTQGRNYLMMFLYYNVMGLVILAPAIYYLSIN